MVRDGESLLDAVRKWAGERILAEWEEDMVAAVEAVIDYETEAHDARGESQRAGEEAA